MVSPNPRRVRAGFTLIELTLAVVLLAVGLLALVGILGRTLQQTQSARMRHAALREAESVADSLTSAGLVASGGRTVAGHRLEWSPEPCAAGTCVRVIARREGRPAERFEVLARVAGSGDRL